MRKPQTANAADAPRHAAAGSQRQVTQEELVQYVKQVAGAVEQSLAGTGLPLVLVADERIAGHYRQVNHYQDLLPPVTLQPDALEQGELLALALDRLGERLNRARDTALERCRVAIGEAADRVRDAIQTIVPAALEGRVSVLFLREGARVWGRYLPDGQAPPEAPRTLVHLTCQQGDRDLTDFAAAQVLAMGGNVFEVPDSLMPTTQPAIALLRF